MNEPTPNSDITDALQQLPDAPGHGAEFWDELNTGLAMQTHAGQPQQRGSRPFGLVAALAAAAVVIVGGFFGIRSLSDPGPTVLLEAADTTTTTVEPDPPSTTQAPRTTTTASADSAATSPTTTTSETTTTAPAAGDPTLFSQRVVSERFHYDVGLPTAFTLDFNTGRGMLIRGPFNTTLQMTNVVWGDVDTSYTDGLQGEILVEQTQLTIPLFNQGPSGPTDRGVILNIDQWTYRDGTTDNRIVRVYNFNDRSIRAELAWDNAAAATLMPELILDDIRMFNAALDLPECSSFGLTPHAAPAGLNAAQVDTYDGIMQALQTCDWNGLEALLPSNGFSASFGGEEAPDVWSNAEAYGETPLRDLHTTLGLTVGIQATEAVWPAAFAQDWSDVSDVARAELRDAGYDDADFAVFADIGYAGYRAGIDTDGNWNFFVAGD